MAYFELFFGVISLPVAYESNDSDTKEQTILLVKYFKAFRTRLYFIGHFLLRHSIYISADNIRYMSFWSKKKSKTNGWSQFLFSTFGVDVFGPKIATYVPNAI
jgi:hypothetical protein